MGIGNKVGRAFLKVAEMGDQIDDGLDRLLGDNRTKAGKSFSRQKTGKKAAAFTRRAKQKNNLTKKKGDKSSGNVGSDFEFFNEKSEDKNKDREFF